MADPCWRPLAGGVAQRRRERRLRSWYRHEAESTHHAAPRGQNMAWAGRGVRDVLHGDAPVHLPSRRLALSTFPLTSKMCLPGRLAGVRPQGRIQRRTVEQTVDAPLLLTLDSPAPLMVEQLVDVLQFVDALVPVAEQVIEVPKIILEDIPVRTLVREPQPVEVPTILTPFIRMLRNVDTLVPRGGRGASGGLQVFLPGQNSSFTVKQIVHSPVPRGGGRRLQGFLPERSATALTVEQNVDKSFPGESLQDVRRGQDSASSSHSPAGVADDAFEGFFALFTRFKTNAALPPHSGSALPRHKSPWTPAAYDVPMALKEEEESEEELDYDVEFFGV